MLSSVLRSNCVRTIALFLVKLMNVCVVEDFESDEVGKVKEERKLVVKERRGLIVLS